MQPDEDFVKKWVLEINNIAPLLKKQGIIVQSFFRSGGQGVVYKGQIGGEEAAIKIYFPGQVEKRIEREINALQRINCPTIVKLIWHGTINIFSYTLQVVVTEFVRGDNLEVILKHNPLNELEIKRLLLDVSTAIDHMWKFRIVHRDLKPSNILVRETGGFCVIDLGVARHLDESTLTAFGRTWGTYGYFSPEQMMAYKQLSCKSDIFSLAIVSVESALGRHPTNRDQQRLISSRFHESLPPPISNLSISGLVKTMFEPKPFFRPTPQTIINSLGDINNI